MYVGVVDFGDYCFYLTKSGHLGFASYMRDPRDIEHKMNLSDVLLFSSGEELSKYIFKAKLFLESSKDYINDLDYDLIGKFLMNFPFSYFDLVKVFKQLHFYENDCMTTLDSFLVMFLKYDYPTLKVCDSEYFLSNFDYINIDTLE